VEVSVPPICLHDLDRDYFAFSPVRTYRGLKVWLQYFLNFRLNRVQKSVRLCFAANSIYWTELVGLFFFLS
jgi:hypothetical protein